MGGEKIDVHVDRKEFFIFQTAGNFTEYIEVTYDVTDSGASGGRTGSEENSHS